MPLVGMLHSVMVWGGNHVWDVAGEGRHVVGGEGVWVARAVSRGGTFA